MRDFERYLNVKYAKQLGKRPLTIYIAPATRDKLLPDLDEGLADVAIGNLTVTDERLKLVDFVPGDEGRRTIDEVVVTGPASPPTRDPGRSLRARRCTCARRRAYYESLTALNERLREGRQGAGQARARPRSARGRGHAGDAQRRACSQLIVVDDWKARMWAQVLPKIKVRNDLVLRAGRAARAGRSARTAPSSRGDRGLLPELGAEERASIGLPLAQLHEADQGAQQPAGSAEWKRFNETVAIFEKYGEQYGFDPLMLAAQGYQESKLRQDARSHVGAIGVMQIMPATGAELKVGDIRSSSPTSTPARSTWTS